MSAAPTPQTVNQGFSTVKAPRNSQGRVQKQNLSPLNQAFRPNALKTPAVKGTLPWTLRHQAALVVLTALVSLGLLRVGLSAMADHMRHKTLIHILKQTHLSQQVYLRAQGQYAPSMEQLFMVNLRGTPMVRLFTSINGYVAESCDHHECAYIDDTGQLYFDNNGQSPFTSSTAFASAEDDLQ